MVAWCLAGLHTWTWPATRQRPKPRFARASRSLDMYRTFMAVGHVQEDIQREPSIDCPLASGVSGLCTPLATCQRMPAQHAAYQINSQSVAGRSTSQRRRPGHHLLAKAHSASCACCPLRLRWEMQAVDHPCKWRTGCSAWAAPCFFSCLQRVLAFWPALFCVHADSVVKM